jgi:carbonic anhydrase
MTDANDLVQRNAEFAAKGFRADLTINPSGNMMVIGCVDPRVDPGHVCEHPSPWRLEPGHPAPH